MDPLERRKFELLVRGMLPAPFVYVVVAWVYLAIADQDPFFGKAVAVIAALTVGAAAPFWGLATYKIARRRQRADARLAQTLLGLAHGPGIAGFVLAIGTNQIWYTLVFGVEALAGLLIVRSKLRQVG